jgi:hypothetical protein
MTAHSAEGRPVLKRRPYWRTQMPPSSRVAPGSAAGAVHLGQHAARGNGGGSVNAVT